MTHNFSRAQEQLHGASLSDVICGTNIGYFVLHFTDHT